MGWGGNPPDHIYIGFLKSVNATQLGVTGEGRITQLLGRACVAMWSRSRQKGICLELLQKVANILKYSFLLFPFREGKNKVTTFSCSQQIRNPVNQLTICSKGNL